MMGPGLHGTDPKKILSAAFSEWPTIRPEHHRGASTCSAFFGKLACLRGFEISHISTPEAAVRQLRRATMIRGTGWLNLTSLPSSLFAPRSW
jgi:hypothetical protein